MHCLFDLALHVIHITLCARLGLVHPVDRARLAVSGFEVTSEGNGTLRSAGLLTVLAVYFGSPQ